MTSCIGGLTTRRIPLVASGPDRDQHCFQWPLTPLSFWWTGWSARNAVAETSTERRTIIKTRANPLALAALAATLTLAGCTEDGPANVTEAEPEAPEAFDTETVSDGWIVPAGGPTIVATHIDACHSLWYRKWWQDAPMSEQEARDTVLAACSRDRSDEELEKQLERLVPRLTAEPLSLPLPDSEVRR